MEFQDFIARPYQESILKIAIKNNTIIYLPTGSGKTFVAGLLIRHFSKSLEKPYLEDGKRTIFLVNTVPLVEQQGKVLENLLPFSVGCYSGDNQVDLWDAQKWKSEIINNQILVMTSQIFLDMILHCYIGLQECNLIIFDECHHAVEDHPMRSIMKQFEYLSPEGQPRIVGLTATLLNGNVKKQKIEEEIESLETTFQSKIATVTAINEVLGYSTNPVELMCTFKENNCMEVHISKVKSIIDKTLCFLQEVNIPKNLNSYNRGRNVHILDDRKDIAKKLKNIMIDVSVHFDILGLYGGLKATTVGLIKLMRLKKSTEEPYLYKILSVVDTKLMYIQKYVDNVMVNENNNDKILTYSTDKVIKLLNLILKYQLDYKEKKNDELCGIIFVQRRSTAQILCHILKDIKKSNELFSFIKPDFVVGFNNNVYLQYAQTRESLYIKKCNMSAIRGFNNKVTNILVSSNVMEEGVDIPICSFITMFDFPMNYRSYVQSKGRARHKSAKYYLLVPAGKEEIKLEKRYQMYKETENFLKEFLIGKNEERSAPTEDDIKSNLYDHIIEPYRVESSNAIATMTSSISLINRYCNSLLHDQFTESAPVWHKEKCNSEVCVYLEFPMQSPLKEVIKGPYMKNIKDAKRAVALKAIQKLYESGELSDLLLPKEHSSVFDDDQVKFLFSHSPEKDENFVQSIHGDFDNGDLIKPGTKKFRRLHKKKCPDVLYNNILNNASDVYILHIIEFYSVCDKSNFTFCTKRFIEKATSQRSFAILSKRTFPAICDFPIYLSFGEVTISLKTNYRKIICAKSEIKKIQQFHCFIFSDILQLLKSFLIFDVSGEEYSYFITPVIFLDGEYNIDYKLINCPHAVEKVCEPDLETKKNLIVTKKDYVDTIVFPWYRESIAGYLVCDVCDDKNSLSEFPSNEFKNFIDYYSNRHSKNIENPIQPLLLVTGISSSLNHLKPNSEIKIKKHKLNELENFEEHFVPELCVRISFPSDLWIKLRSLPSILHRLEGLYRAEQLYTVITQELKLNTYLSKEKWAPLTCDEKSMKYKLKKTSTDICEPTVAGRVSPVAEMLDMKAIEFQYNQSNKVYPWKEEQEPIDIERNIDTVSLLDVEYYENFISQKLYSECDETHSMITAPKLAITFENIEKHVPIKMIQNKVCTTGLELKDFYQALVAASTNDIINFERYETLGDSFLKFSTTLYLYLRFPTFDEGKLTYLKGHIVGNKNLFYCAKTKELGSFMNVTDFLPNFDMIPPCFCLPSVLMQYSNTLSRSALYQLNITKEEQFNGSLKRSTLEKIMNIISTNCNENSLESVLNSLTSQVISDKCVADCVEALIGCFFVSGGIEAALKLLGWFGILPKSIFLEELLNHSPPSPIVNKKNITDIEASIEFHLVSPKTLEKVLGYKFQNKAYILQAFSHSSYISNKLTECYQKLEFLGDAILDFLITCHIYETCGNLSPGELTDLRSALVNNVVFGSLIVKYGLHKYLLAMNPQLSNAILKFVKHQEENNFAINDNVLILLEESDYNLAAYVDVPKVLGDLFESLAGAIFLDSGMNLEVVWKIFYKLMRPIIEDFSRNVPKNIVRKLYEETKAVPKFSPPISLEDGTMMVGVTFWIDGHKKKVYGYGTNKNCAKVAAAKIALKALAANERINACL